MFTVSYFWFHYETKCVVFSVTHVFLSSMFRLAPHLRVDGLAVLVQMVLHVAVVGAVLRVRVGRRLTPARVLSLHRGRARHQVTHRVPDRVVGVTLQHETTLVNSLRLLCVHSKANPQNAHCSATLLRYTTMQNACPLG